MYNYKLEIAYDGTNYCGWQIQPNGASIQQTIQDQIAIILRQPITLIGSGRTDAGVHAKGQIAHFKTGQLIEFRQFLNSINSILPHDIRIFSIESVDSSFHAQYSATGKIYHYHLHLNQVMDPFQRLYSWRIPHPINVDLLIKASQFFVGTHNFTSFSNEAHSGSASRDPIRTLSRLDVVQEERGVRLELEADGFLYKMVRNIVGILTEVSGGKRQLNDIPQIFKAKDRRSAGKAAPPQGLFLMQVKYEKKSTD